MSSPFNKVTSLRVVKLFMHETGTYNPQFSRPYGTSVDGFTMKAISERAVELNGGKFNTDSIAGLASSFISPQATPESVISIANGWNEKRIRFLLELECQYTVGGTCGMYIQGFTNFNGVAMSGSIAPEMDFYINSIITTSKVMQNTPYGTQLFEHITDNSHLLCSDNWQSMYQPGQKQMIRPVDIFSMMQTSHIPSSFGSDGTQVFDTRVILKPEAVKSSRDNNLAASYAAKIIDGYTTGSNMSGFSSNENDILQASKRQVVEEQAAIDPFLSSLNSITERGISNHFRYSDLNKLDSNVAHVTNFVVTSQTQKANIHQAGMTSSWEGSDRTTLVATILSQSVPSLMMDLMISRIVFKTTNHDMQGFVTTVIIDGKGLTNRDLTRNFEMFKRRLENEILRDISFNNQELFAIGMSADLLGDTWVSVSLNGAANVDYVTPSFCDGLLVPVLTTNVNTSQQITSDFETLVTNVRDSLNQSEYSNNLSPLV